MATTHNLGFPRIGAKRELKFAVEKYWDRRLTPEELESVASNLRELNWSRQDIDWIPVGDFSYYDQVLDMSHLLGNIPTRAVDHQQSELDTYFRVARGRSRKDDSCCENDAGEMTKWFDTNYHYIVPEFSRDTEFALNPDSLLNQINEAEQTQKNIKPVIIGPLTYLWLGKSIDDSPRLDLLNKLLPVYQELFQLLEKRGIAWLQIDEPILVTELSQHWQKAFAYAYSFLANRKVNVMLTSYFGELRENLPLACGLPIDGLHLDVTETFDEVVSAINLLPDDCILSLGVVSGRNIWKSDLNSLLDQLEPIARQLKSRLWLAPSCSLLHVPVDLNTEPNLDAEISQWLAFAVQKLEEIRTLADAINFGRDSVSEELTANSAAIEARLRSKRIHNSSVQDRITNRSASDSQRQAEFSTRAAKQRVSLQLPDFPTTTIGSFPQTDKIRRTRRQFKRGEISEGQYEDAMRQEIADCVRWQEELELDVLVHGEAERNDMVEYFGEQLEGCVISQNGWVQSYGSRCVKPPIIFGDISRSHPMTVHWTRYAQSLTSKPMKGMLTGPVTILNWSFVRDDQPRSQTCEQIAFAIRDEVADLEHAGIQVIQIDEPALREGLPLRTSDTPFYLRWAVNCFRMASSGVADDTQIHTHMCYSEFNDIIESITDLDADVITIESSRSNMELIKAFTDFEYPNDIGPGVYDIHSPNTPSTEQMVQRIQLAMKFLPKERLWVNPDCGLKTRRWSEVTPAIRNMVSAAQALRNAVSSSP